MWVVFCKILCCQSLTWVLRVFCPFLGLNLSSTEWILATNLRVTLDAVAWLWLYYCLPAGRWRGVSFVIFFSLGWCSPGHPIRQHIQFATRGKNGHRTFFVLFTRKIVSLAVCVIFFSLLQSNSIRSVSPGCFLLLFSLLFSTSFFFFFFYPLAYSSLVVETPALKVEQKFGRMNNSTMLSMCLCEGLYV